LKSAHLKNGLEALKQGSREKGKIVQKREKKD